MLNTDDNAYFERVTKALECISRGGMVVVVDDFDRENEGDLVAAAEKAGPETINFMARYGRGLICQPITEKRARELDLPLMTNRQTDPLGTAFTVTVDHVNTGTGISAIDRSLTVKSLADSETSAEDLRRPGHIFPLIAKNGGVLKRKGHTEAAVDLARLSGLEPAGVICEIMKDDGTMARVPDLEILAAEHNLPMLSVEDLIRYRDAIGDFDITLKSASQMPTEYGKFRIMFFESSDPAAEEIAVLESIFKPENTPLVRLHSECATGEIFGSIRCECGPQLNTALERIGREGGALVYMKQEGRGIGLMEKIKAYSLQDNGADTVEANLMLGHPADARRFGAGAAVLKKLGYKNIRLLTNNPEKEKAFRNMGINIEKRESLVTGVRPENIQYLKTKVEKFNHILEGVRL